MYASPNCSGRENALTCHRKQPILALTLTPALTILMAMRLMKMPTPTRLHRCSSFKISLSFSNCVMLRRLLQVAQAWVCVLSSFKLPSLSSFRISLAARRERMVRRAKSVLRSLTSRESTSCGIAL